MADGFIRVAPDSTGKELQTFENTIGGEDVHAEAVVLVDNAGNYLPTLPVSLAANINANFIGPVTVQSSNASNFLATVSGIVTAIGPITNAELRASEVAISAATLPLPALASSSTKQSDGSQKTQIVDPINASNMAGVTAGALNVYLPSIAATQSGTWNIGTITTFPANSSFNLSQVGGSSATTNAGNASAGTQRVILATDQPNVAVTLQNAPNIGLQVLTGARAGIATGQVTMSNVATQIVGARATRRSVTIRNHDTTNSGFIGAAAVATSNGILLLPYDSISVDFTGVIQGISATTSNVTFGYIESFD